MIILHPSDAADAPAAPPYWSIFNACCGPTFQNFLPHLLWKDAAAVTG